MFSEPGARSRATRSTSTGPERRHRREAPQGRHRAAPDRVRTGGGHDEPSRLTPLAVDAGHLFWSSPNGFVFRLAKGGADLTVLADDQPNPAGIAVDPGDAGAVYWANRVGSIRKVPKAGGAVTTLAVGQLDAIAIAVDEALSTGRPGRGTSARSRSELESSRDEAACTIASRAVRRTEALSRATSGVCRRCAFPGTLAVLLAAGVVAGIGYGKERPSRRRGAAPGRAGERRRVRAAVASITTARRSRSRTPGVTAVVCGRDLIAYHCVDLCANAYLAQLPGEQVR